MQDTIRQTIERTIEQMRRDDTEFITPETVAMFARCTEGNAALVLLDRANARNVALQQELDRLRLEVHA